jgi:tetratricopeptide (TPR) repeat protein
MKKTALLFLIIITVASCKDFLQLQPEYQMSSDNFYRDQNDFEKSMTGVYASIRGLYSSSSILFLTELSTDNTEIQWHNSSVDQVQCDQNAFTATNTLASGIWTNLLNTVYRCNVILNKIESVDFDAAAKSRITGEARFVRAFCYFYLVRLFDNVPVADRVFDSPSQIEEADLSLQPKEAIYKIIQEDLTAAATLIPAGRHADKTTASPAAVKTLLGKVYLTLGNYDKAAQVLKEVIDLQEYTLVDYRSLFTNGSSNLAESVFEIQFVKGKGLGNNFSAMFTPAVTSMALFTGNLQGGGRIVPTADMINAYEKGDLRKEASVRDTIPLIGGGKTYGRYGIKFVDFSAIDLNDGSSTFTVMRYADVLLMYAEALNELGRTPEALPNVNMVRQRAGLAPLSGLDQTGLRLELEKERRVEFLYEGHRWFDLVRTGRARQLLNAHHASQGFSFTVEDYELLLPIPQNEIDLNPSLKQNPGY